MKGRLDAAGLERAIGDGTVDTIVTAFPDRHYQSYSPMGQYRPRMP